MNIRLRARLWGSFALIALALIAVLTLLPAATPAASANDGSARIRAVHGVPDFGPVDVYLGSTKLVGDISFFSVSEYLSVRPGHYRVRVIPAGDDVERPRRLFVNIRADIRPGQEYSIIASGSAIERNVRGTVLEDDNSAPTAGQVRLRVAHFSPDAPPVDIFINGERSPVQGLAFRNATGYLDVPPGTYEVGVAPAGGEPIFTTDLTLEAGTVYTAWANGLLAGSGATAFTVTPSIDAQFGLARVRAVHAIPDIAGSPVDVYVNDTKVVTFDFFSVTPYLPLTPGTYDVRVVLEGGNPATDAVIAAEVTVEDGQDYSIIARGTGGTFGATVLEDDNSAPTAGQVRLRVAHFSPDAPPVDIFINGERSPVQGLAFRNATGYLDVPPGTYEVGVAPAGGEPIFTTDLTLEAGTVYTAWANGLLAGSGATAFTVTPSIDAQYPTTFVRLLHAVPDAPAVDIFVDGDRVAAGVVFGDLSAFLPIEPGTYDITVNVAGTNTSVISDAVTLENAKRYTLAVIGRLADGPEGVSIALFEERRRSLAAGSSSLQVVNLAPDIASFDLMRNGTPLISALGFGAAGNTELPAGVHSVSIRMDNGTALEGTVTTRAEESATLFVVGLNGAAPESQRLRVIGAGNFSAPAQVGTFVVHLPLVVR